MKHTKICTVDFDSSSREFFVCGIGFVVALFVFRGLILCLCVCVLGEQSSCTYDYVYLSRVLVVILINSMRYSSPNPSHFTLFHIHAHT